MAYVVMCEVGDVVAFPVCTCAEFMQADHVAASMNAAGMPKELQAMAWRRNLKVKFFVAEVPHAEAGMEPLALAQATTRAMNLKAGK
jgi:hypothetical protein